MSYGDKQTFLRASQVSALLLLENVERARAEFQAVLDGKCGGELHVMDLVPALSRAQVALDECKEFFSRFLDVAPEFSYFDARTMKSALPERRGEK